eukprot:COSAG01_NODE_21427_length_902_cov_2.565380_1_plen_162_part_00
MYKSASFDETRLEGDTGGNGRKAPTEKVVKHADSSQHEALTGCGAASMTGVGGCYLDMQPLCPVFMPKGTTVQYEDYAEHLPIVTVDNKRMTAKLVPTAGGGMTDAVIKDVMEKAITWRWDLTSGELFVITTDGVGTHISPAFLILRSIIIAIFRSIIGEA